MATPLRMVLTAANRVMSIGRTAFAPLDGQRVIDVPDSAANAYATAVATIADGNAVVTYNEGTGQFTATQGQPAQVAADPQVQALMSTVATIETAQVQPTTPSKTPRLDQNITDTAAVTGRVTTLEASQSTQDTAISARATTASVTALAGRVTTLEGSQATTAAMNAAIAAAVATARTRVGLAGSPASALITVSGLILNIAQDTATITWDTAFANGQVYEVVPVILGGTANGAKIVVKSQNTTGCVLTITAGLLGGTVTLKVLAVPR